MPKQGAQLKQLSSTPITWLSESKLKLSILLRHEAARNGKASEALKYLTQENISSDRILAAFPKIREPDGELLRKASDDYLRCILAKSIAEVYRKITPKYRNEAARKQFFKKLVEIAEAIHLTASWEKLHGILTGAETDDTALWINSEFERLIGQKVDLSSEHSAKLSSARTELRSLMRELEHIVGIQWHESERYQQSLSLASFFPPGVMENDGTWRWGSQWYPTEGVLNLNPPILFLDVLRKGVLAREGAIFLSPRNLEVMPDAPRILCEQAEYLAFKLMERKNDRELWAEARHGPRLQTRFMGHELIDFFQFYEMLVGGSLYRDVWARLKEFGGARLIHTDYYTIFNTLAARPTNPNFARDELQLLDLLSKRPDVKAGEAARLLKVSIPTAMKAIRDLMKKAGLRFTVIVDMTKIGLVENLLLLSTNREADVLRVLSRFPYCRQVFRTYGQFDLFCVLDIPQEHGQFPREFVQRMVDRQLVTRYRLLQLERDFQSTNLSRYDVDQKRWDVHWDTWGVSLRENLTKAQSSSSYLGPLRDSPRSSFDSLDMDILSDLQNDCRSPFSMIGRNRGVSGAYVGKKVSKMLKENAFRYAIWPLKIGAEDWGIVSLACPRHAAYTLAQHLSQLPAWRGGLVTGDFDGLFAMVWCPSGELKQLFKAIDDRLVRSGFAQSECLSPVGEWIVARWLPVDPYPQKLCTAEGTWLFDKPRYLSIIQ